MTIKTKVLSRREKATLVLIARGYTNIRIARQFNVSINSVSTFVWRIYEKYGVNCRAQAVIIGIRRGVVDISDCKKCGQMGLMHKNGKRCI